MQILYEDVDVLVVAKPAGVTVIPGRDETIDQSLQGMLQSTRRERLWVVHRLDRDTSGVVLFARNATAHRTLSMAFEHRGVEKTYLAWTRGIPASPQGVITAPLHPARKGRMRPARPDEPGALPSETAYRVLRTRGPIACVEARPKTGRQHQIRVHLRLAGAPLLADRLYGKEEAVEPGALGEGSPSLARLALHAARLAWGALVVECPLPEDLRRLDEWISRAPASSD